jgi:hypothetical protein
MVRHAFVVVALGALGALGACGGPKAPSPPTPLPPSPPIDAALDSPEVAVDEDVHDHGGDLDEDDHALECHEVVRDIAKFPPALGDTAPERDWSLAIRAHILEEDCEHDWSYEDRVCLNEKGPAVCTPQLPNEMATRLTQLADLAQKIADAQKKPATIGCKQVVEAHYAPVRWQNRLEGFAPKVRSQMIADSRALMQKACAADRWTASTRACLVLGGADLCFFTTNIRRMWGYPADGSVRTLGIAQCDEYSALVAKFAACTMIEPSVRDALVRVGAALKAQIAASPPAERAAKANGCEAAMGTVQNVMTNAGC